MKICIALFALLLMCTPSSSSRADGSGHNEPVDRLRDACSDGDADKLRMLIATDGVHVAIHVFSGDGATPPQFDDRTLRSRRLSSEDVRTICQVFDSAQHVACNAEPRSHSTECKIDGGSDRFALRFDKRRRLREVAGEIHN